MFSNPIEYQSVLDTLKLETGKLTSLRDRNL